LKLISLIHFLKIGLLKSRKEQKQQFMRPCELLVFLREENIV
jgi:hypothetical protein